MIFPKASNSFVKSWVIVDLVPFCKKSNWSSNSLRVLIVLPLIACSYSAFLECKRFILAFPKICAFIRVMISKAYLLSALKAWAASNFANVSVILLFRNSSVVIRLRGVPSNPLSLNSWFPESKSYKSASGPIISVTVNPSNTSLISLVKFLSNLSISGFVTNAMISSTAFKIDGTFFVPWIASFNDWLTVKFLFK